MIIRKATVADIEAITEITISRLQDASNQQAHRAIHNEGNLAKFVFFGKYGKAFTCPTPQAHFRL